MSRTCRTASSLNLGLNGITLLTGQNEGEIALKAEPWVEEMDRRCYVVTREVGKQTSLPVMLHVRKKAGAQVVRAPPRLRRV